MATKKSRIRRHKTLKKSYGKLYGKISFYKHPPNTTTIGQYKFLFLPVKCNTIKVECRVFGGHYLENKHNIGISHLLEHIITQSWKKCYKKNCSIYLEKYGTLSNAHTRLMSTSYWIYGLAKFTPILLEYILSIILDPRITSKRLHQEIEIVRNELVNMMNSPHYKLVDKSSRTMFDKFGLQYSSDYEMQLQLLQSFTVGQLSEFARRIISTKRLLFVISGSFKKKSIVAAINKILHKLPPADDSLSVPVVPEDICYRIKKQVVYVHNAHNKNSTILFQFPLPYFQGEKLLLYMPIISAILGNGLNSLLLRELRIKRNLVYSTSVSYQTNFCGTLLSISIATVQENLEEVLKKTIQVLKTYQKKHILSTTLEHYKLRHLLSMQSIFLATPTTVSQFYSSQYFYQLDKKIPKIYTLSHISNLIHALTLPDVSRLLRIFFNLDDCTIFYMSKGKISFTVKDY